ncbi:hypothetical protein ACWIT3_06110 [Pasteurella sp. P03HT]
MSEQKQSPFLTALFSLLPIVLLLGIDFFALFLQTQAKAISHLGFAVLVAQLICLLVFSKGQICPGQRSRLRRVNGYFALFWGVWFFISVFSNYHLIFTDMISLCGIALVLGAWHQPQDIQLRRSMLIMASIIGVLGCVCYLLMFIEIPRVSVAQYNLFAQGLVGLILANLALVISRNRLQGLIALFPLLMLVTLLLNAVSTLGLLFYLLNSVSYVNEFAWLLYFVLHLVIAGVIGLHIFKQWTLGYQTLFFLLFLSASLPLWANFAYIV